MPVDYDNLIRFGGGSDLNIPSDRSTLNQVKTEVNRVHLQFFQLFFHNCTFRDQIFGYFLWRSHRIYDTCQWTLLPEAVFNFFGKGFCKALYLTRLGENLAWYFFEKGNLKKKETRQFFPQLIYQEIRGKFELNAE